MGQHANYSPSRLSRIIACPGSVSLIEAMKEKGTVPFESVSSPEAEEGTRMHKVTERLDITMAKTSKSIYEAAEDLGINREDTEVAKECLDYAATIKNAILPKGQYIETTESVVSLSPFGLPEVWGTSDKTILALSELTAHVIDWKFGRGVEVSAIENVQLMAYGAGSIGWPTHIKRIHLHIVQPLIGNFSSWNISAPDLFKWVHVKLAGAIADSKSVDPVFNPGMPQCRWCEAKSNCKYHYMSVIQRAQEVFTLAKQDKNILQPEQIAKILAHEDFIKKAFKDFATYGFNQLRDGKPFPGYKLVRGRANRKWVDEAKAAQYIGEHAPHIDTEKMFVSKFFSPAAAEKLSRALAKDQEFQKLIHKPEGKLSLAVEADNRKAVASPNSVESAFAHLKQS